MWLEPISHCIIAVSLLGQTQPAAQPATSEPIVTHQAVFALPFRVESTSDPARQPVEVQLYVSNDQGQNWHQYAKVPPTQKQFMFRAGVDGEYWFAIRTVDSSGRMWPYTITTPSMRVRVEASPVQTSAPETALHVRSAEKPVADASASPSDAPRGSVAIAINPPVGRKFTSPDGKQGEATRQGDTPTGERPRMVNSTLFELEYDIDSVGPSGIGRVELWGTQDHGRTWSLFTQDNDNRSPLLTNVKEEGLYGFRVVVVNGSGFGGKPPANGDLPDLWVGIDLTKPTARITSIQQGSDSESGQLIISWEAGDRLLAARPVSLSFGQTRAGPWLPIASGLENTGRYAWKLDNRTPAQVYVRLEVRDDAGNVAAYESPDAVTLDQSRPIVRVRDIRPVGQSGPRTASQR